MKLEDISVGDFIAILKHATGNVYLVAGDGVYFNLNSTLSQLYCIKMLQDKTHSGKISPEIKVTDENDKKLFLQYLLKNNNFQNDIKD